MPPTAAGALHRRRLLAAAAASLACGVGPRMAGARAAPGTPRHARLAAAWADGDTHRVGVLAARGVRLHAQHAIDVPTRAHGLLALPDGTLLAVARRPGDWLLRWRPGQRDGAWTWAEPGRSFNGHAALSADGRTVFTTETDADSGAGLVGVRDALSLRKRAEWPSHGIDAHALLLDGATLLVANGGIRTRPETGRTKHALDRMDSSLVRLDAANGRLLAQWRLSDPRLSLRHLAVSGPRVGVALQAEHETAAARAAAPVLAVLDDAGLHMVDGDPALRGYGADIVALGRGFAVSAPRAGRAALWQPGEGWAPPLRLDEAGALARLDDALLVGGHAAAARLAGGRAFLLAVGPVRLDNHWCAMR